ncbi:rhomboid-like protein [Streptomyces sp. NBC_00096]|uniref:rhomboid-like protein n=1 Tax=Streptomyces sp. NBC_00096 TaxID=2975650 RepID=UPI00324FA7FE
MIEHHEPEPSRPVRSWIRSAPGTHIWLLIIAVTSIVVVIVPDHLEHVLLHRNSSNIHELARHPMRALLSSAFWIEDPASLPLYAVLFEVFHANVERWLGTLRWLVIVATGHITATLVSQRVVLMAIQDNRAPRSMVHVVDIGVSYGLAAAVGVLTYRLPGLWRFLYLAGSLAFFGLPLITDGTFTDLGHVIALAVGLLAWPLTRHPHPRLPKPPKPRPSHGNSLVRGVRRGAE